MNLQYVLILGLMLLTLVETKRKYPDKNKWKNAYKFANDAMERKMKSNLKKEGIPKTSSKNNEEENNVKREFQQLKNNMEKLLKKMQARGLDDSLVNVIDSDFYEDAEESKRKKRMSDEPVYSIGANPQLLIDESRLYSYTPRQDMLRDGQATDSDTCNYVRAVPAELRDPYNFFDPINEFYQKYTEVYGIPILGSPDVTDLGLSRACYEVKFLLASRYDIRNIYYKLYGRIVLIGDNEQQTSLFEYSTWDSAYWDNRVRGLGPTITIPLTSAGDDNQRCKPEDRYSKEDILIHEFAHGIHSMAAVYAIPGFHKRLCNAYQNAMNNGKYAGKYAATNCNEYFAVGAQIYFDSYDKTDYKYTNEENVEVPITNRDALQVYDPDLVDLLDEVFPCNNKFVHRCTWKDCNIDNYELIHSREQVIAKSMCTVIKSHFKKDNASECGEYTCYHLGNAFNFKKTNKASYCYVLHCEEPDDLEISQSNGAFDVYKIKNIPLMDFTAETTEPMDTVCSINTKTVYVAPDVEKSKRCNVPDGEKEGYGPDFANANRKKCKARGGCYDDLFGCHYATQECVDHSIYCPEWSTYVDHNGVDECTRNPAFMLLVCPLSCNACKYSYRLQDTQDEAFAMCQDDFPDCYEFDCPTYKSICKLTCNECSLPSNWADILGIPDYVPEPIVV